MISAITVKMVMTPGAGTDNYNFIAFIILILVTT